MSWYWWNSTQLQYKTWGCEWRRIIPAHSREIISEWVSYCQLTPSSCFQLDCVTFLTKFCLSVSGSWGYVLYMWLQWSVTSLCPMYSCLPFTVYSSTSTFHSTVTVTMSSMSGICLNTVVRHTANVLNVRYVS